MQVYTYILKTGMATVNFFVAAANQQEAIKLFDITETEFMENCKITVDKVIQAAAIGHPNTVLYCDVGNTKLKKLETGESTLTIRLKHLLGEFNLG